MESTTISPPTEIIIVALKRPTGMLENFPMCLIDDCPGFGNIQYTGYCSIFCRDFSRGKEKKSSCDQKPHKDELIPMDQLTYENLRMRIKIKFPGIEITDEIMANRYRVFVKDYIFPSYPKTIVPRRLVEAIPHPEERYPMTRSSFENLRRRLQKILPEGDEFTDDMIFSCYHVYVVDEFGNNIGDKKECPEKNTPVPVSPAIFEVFRKNLEFRFHDRIMDHTVTKFHNVCVNTTISST